MLAAACLGGEVLLVDLLLCGGADVNRLGADGRTPLVAAAEKGHAGVVKRLLAAGAQVDLAGHRGETALMASSRAGHLAAVRCLLEGGASPTLAPGPGYEPLWLALSRAHPEVADLLLAYGAAPPNFPACLSGFLKHFSLKNKRSMVRYLLRLGVSPHGVLQYLGEQTRSWYTSERVRLDRVVLELLAFGAENNCTLTYGYVLPVWYQGRHELQRASAAVAAELPRHLRCHVPELVCLVREFIHLTPPRVGVGSPVMNP